MSDGDERRPAAVGGLHRAAMPSCPVALAGKIFALEPDATYSLW
jgi:hypothetical protein